MSKYTHKQLLSVASSLLVGCEPDELEGSEYLRGMCELIGRLELDCGGKGEGTGENALLVAEYLLAELGKKG